MLNRFAIFLCVLTLVLALAGTASAVYLPVEDSDMLLPEETDNESSQDQRWTTASTLRSYLEADADGTYLRVEYTNGKVVVEQYSAEMKLIWKKSLEMELPLWGGFFAGTRYNFLVEGQDNLDEDDNIEVVRVIRYSKEWKRIDAVGIYGCNTIRPFSAGSLRMTESGDYLYIHTCHQMYASSDGLNHQANMSFQVHIPDMTVPNKNYRVSHPSYEDYVSHSFNQFVLTDGDDIIKVDHGDAYPRAVTLARFPGYATGTYSSMERIVLLQISGNTGDNYTGVTLGGLTASSSSYLVAGTSVDQAQFDTAKVRNLFTVSVPKDNLTDGAVTFRWITSYGENDGIYVSTPQIVRAGSRFLLLWTEGESAYADAKTLKYVLLDGTGAVASQIGSADGRLSDCKPVVRDGKIIWYVTDGSGAVFYSIDLDEIGAPVRRQARSTWVKTNKGRIYYDAEGKVAVGWLPLDDKTYYMDDQGYALTGLQVIDGKRYLFDADGVMQSARWYTDEASGARYYFGQDGAALTGFVRIHGTRYVYDAGTGDWVEREADIPYCFGRDGRMVTGWVIHEHRIYYFADSGRLITENYYSSSNELRTSVDGQTCVFDASDGTLKGYGCSGETPGFPGCLAFQATGTWYYFDETKDASTEDPAPQIYDPANGTTYYGHAHGWEDAVYEWAPDSNSVTASRVCTLNPAHVETETVSAINEANPPTMYEEGTFFRAVYFTNPLFENQEERTVIPPLGTLDMLLLPASLPRIEEEAFAGLACEAVVIPYRCTEIASRAFADCPNLVYALVPENAQIAEDAFDGCERVYVYRNPGWYSFSEDFE